MRLVIVKIILAVAGICLTAIAVHAQDSPHGKLAVACDQCHATDSWKVLTSGAKFKHAQTGFPLEGQHAQVACRQCHATLKFSEARDRCGSCHTDVHRNELGANCERCHSPESWLVPDMPQRHVSTRFALLGAHRRAQCRACHTNEQKHTYAGAPIECVSCHRNDYDATTAPPHRASGINTNCESCHSVSATTWGRGFDHNTSGFPLKGAHVAVACSQCHQNNVYKGLTHDCYGCHAAKYNATSTPPHRASGFGTDCVQCHSSASVSWGGKFDHATTAFPLVGSHTAVACAQCHANNVFKGLPSNCYSCHRTEYSGTTKPPHQSAGFSTDCIQCHTAASSTWTAKFDHATTAFPLVGSHAAVPCADCHKNNVYKGLPSTCFSCHVAEYNATKTPPHQASGLGTDCIQCHSASAATWGGKFDHAATAFPLTGLHMTVQCMACHKNNVFKGLAMACNSCHAADYTATKNPPHQAAGFGTDCAQCHTTASSSWASKFDHATTAFPLVGSHAAVPCADCHKNNVYKGLPSACFSCHAAEYNATKTPPHQASGLGTDCIQCHSASAATWGGKFDHAATAFPLTGLHMTVQCMACHKNNIFKGLPAACYSCHATEYTATKSPPHQAAGFGTDCAQCHTTASSTWASKFDHSTTGFQLVGSHAAVPCTDCHKNNVYKGLPAACFSCHSADYMATKNPPHQASGLSTDCNLCHSASSPTWGGKFDHSATLFPLTGTHVTVPCMTCHKNNVFKGLPATCYSCHANDYAATTTPPHQASGIGTNCADCHSASSATWGGKFDHTSTGFPLNGSHAAVPCLQCHKNNVFKGLPANCYSCHSVDFTKTTNPPHQSSGFGTDCVTCHGTGAANWAGSFNHSQTGFALNGRHVGVPCVQCHVNNVYKGLPSTCVSCHQQDYNGSTNPNHTTSGFPTTCETCHSTSGWTPSTFDHEPSFPISSTAVHRPGRWTSCADCHTSASDFRVFSCLTCHEHAQSSMDSKHKGNSRYSYTSSACYNCHPRGRN